ncbi:hypothetical protein ACFL3C_04615 [Patescibacteria group bacterium]
MMRNNILFKILCVLLFVLIALGIADYCILDSFWLTDYIRGSFTETIGILITLIFVERIVASQRNKEEKNGEKKQIRRLNKILKPELKRVLQYASFMTTKDGEQNYTITKNFQFNRLANFHIPALSVFDAPERSFKLMFQSIEINLTTIREALLNLEFKYYPNLERLLLGYIDSMSKGNPLNFLSCLEHNKGFPESIKKMISEVPDDVVPTYEEYKPDIYEGKSANIMTSIIRLYEIINFHIEFEHEYSEQVSDLLIEKR